jgi:RNA polymerase sigma-70 factor (ECF subfamily)
LETSDQSVAEPLTSVVAFDRFYEEALPRVFSYFLDRCGGSTSVAEDLTQETFMAAVEQIREQKRIDHPLAWILGTARHKLVDHYRAREREDRRMEALKTEVEQDELIEWQGDESRGRAIAALETVPGPQRAALVLRYLDSLSVGDVAQALGKSLEATQSLIARGKRSFKQAYSEVLHG